MTLLLLFALAAGLPGSDAQAAGLTHTDYGFALWDAEGQHLSMDEVLSMRSDYGAATYFFRSVEKQDLDLVRLKKAGYTLIMVAHPGYAPFKDSAFCADELKVRNWARDALSHPEVDGLALDIEGHTATSQKNIAIVLAEEAHARGKTFHAVPHFVLFDRWEGTLLPEQFNTHVDIVWPWLYNRLRQPDYPQGLIALLRYWREKGVTVPVYPIFDHGRTSYSGIPPAEAQGVPHALETQGVKALCLFQPHVSYRMRSEDEDFAALWKNLKAAYGFKGSPPDAPSSP